MCIPHGGGTTSNGYEKEDKPKKHIKKVSQEQFEKGDPNFVDERKAEDSSKKQKKSFLADLLK